MSDTPRTADVLESLMESVRPLAAQAAYNAAVEALGRQAIDLERGLDEARAKAATLRDSMRLDAETIAAKDRRIAELERSFSETVNAIDAAAKDLGLLENFRTPVEKVEGLRELAASYREDYEESMLAVRDGMVRIRDVTEYAGQLSDALGELQHMLAKQLMGSEDGVQCAACGKRSKFESHEDSCPVNIGLAIIEDALAKNPVTNPSGVSRGAPTVSGEASGEGVKGPHVHEINRKAATWEPPSTARPFSLVVDDPHNCPTCGRLQFSALPKYDFDAPVAERLRIMADLYDPKHVEGGCNWCTDVGAARLMREAANWLDTRTQSGTKFAPACKRCWVQNDTQPPEGERVIIEHKDGERRMATWTGFSWKCEGEANFHPIVRWARLPSCPQVNRDAPVECCPLHVGWHKGNCPECSRTAIGRKP